MLYASVRKMGVLSFPFPQSNGKPETVNAQGDDRQQQPFDPVTEQLHSGTIKAKPVSIDNRVLGFPIVDHAERPWKTDSKRAHCDDRAQYAPADQLQKTAVKIRIAHDFYLLFSRGL